MATIENFVLRFKTEGQQAITKASDAVKGLSDQVSNLGASTGPLGNALSSLAGRMGPIGAAATAAAGAMAALGLRAITIADEISDMNAATGISASRLLSFKQSVIEAGGSATDFATIATKLNMSVQEAAAGNENLQNAFKTLGIFVTDAGGQVRNTGDILDDITTKFQQGSITGEQYAAAIDLLGKTVSKLELGKLQTLSDPFRDAEIEQLAKYAGAYDSFMNRMENGLITYTARMLEWLDVNRRMMSDAELAAQGMKRIPQSFWKGDQIVQMSPQEVAERNENVAEMNRLRAKQASARETTMQAAGGGYGITPKGKDKEADREAERAAKEERRRLEALARELKALDALESAYSRSNQTMLDKIQLDREMIDLSENQKEIRQSLADVETSYTNQMVKLTDELANLEMRKQQGDKNSLELIPKVKAQMATLTEAYNSQRDAVRELVTAKQADQAASRLADFQKTAFEKVREEALKLKADLDFIKMGFDPNSNTSARFDEATKAVEEYVKAEAKIGNVIPLSQQLSIQMQYLQNLEEILDLEQQIDMERKKFSFGWEKAMKEYAENARNGAMAAERIFSKATQGMEDMIVNFAKTGKLEWKSFVASILEELLRAQIKQVIADVFNIGGGRKSGTAEGGSWLGKLLGFANGGMIPTNQPVLVGERGPEILSGVGGRTVIPNDQIGGGATYVTYNIQAVDAMSFKQMVARDPSFIYAVTEQGRKSLPQTRR